MKFGKLENINKVDFSIKKDPEENLALLECLPKDKEKPTLFVGCTGWSMKEWKGKVYPKKAKANEFLQHYAKQFNTIELNTTHYRIPDFSTIEKWSEDSPEDFHFCPKILQRISHSSDLAASNSLLQNFCDAIGGLGKKLGSSFIQLPPYFKEDRLLLLKHFLERWPKHLELAVEVRHENWFQNKSVGDSLFELLKEYNVSPVITDVAGRRDVLHMRLTSSFAVIRFVGNDLHQTDFERIDDWCARLKYWFDNGLKKAYFFTHEPDNLNAPDIAKYMVEQMSKNEDIITRGPSFIQEDTDSQMSLF